MTRDPRRVRRLARWYPRTWRERYGDELIALVHDMYGDEPLPVRARLSLVRAGLVEWTRVENLVGRRASSADPVRAGTLNVWFAWLLFVLAGAGFAKYAEHWDALTPSAHRTFPAMAITLMQVSAAMGATLCGAAAVVSWTSLRHYVRRHGAAHVARLLGPGLVAGLLAITSSAMVIAIAHGATPAQRNHPGVSYIGVVLGWSALLASCAAVIAWNVGRLVWRLDYTARQVAVLVRLARALTTTMVVIGAAFALWWFEMALFAPRFWSAGRWEVATTTWSPPMVLSAVLMGVGLALARRGVRLTRHRPAEV